LHEDEAAFSEFAKRLQPIIGNLEEVHEGIEREEAVEVVTPMAFFTFIGWMGSKRDVVYTFASHDLM
jgi:hypothetical protein